MADGWTAREVVFIFSGIFPLAYSAKSTSTEPKTYWTIKNSSNWLSLLHFFLRSVCSFLHNKIEKKTKPLNGVYPFQRLQFVGWHSLQKVEFFGRSNSNKQEKKINMEKIKLERVWGNGGGRGWRREVTRLTFVCNNIFYFFFWFL